VDPPFGDTVIDLDYQTLPDHAILALPIEMVQDEGFIFVWTTNSKRKICEAFLEGERIQNGRDYIVVQTRLGGELQRGVEKYLSHTVEECLVGVRGRYNEINKDFNL